MKQVPTATERKFLLLENADVSTWIKDRPPGTASVQLDHLRIFLERTSLNVDSLLKYARSEERRLRNVVLDFIDVQQARGLKSRYVANIWWSIRSFLNSVGAAPSWNPKVKQSEADEENASRMVPTHAQVRGIATAVKSARDRMAVMVLASSGVRIGTFATQNGHAGGLRLKNLVDLELRPEPHFRRDPPMLRVPAHLSKGGAGYYTGLTDEAGGTVVAYLMERVRRGEKLSPESPLVAPDNRGKKERHLSKDGFDFLVRKSLAARIQAGMDTIAPGGIRWTPHSLRAFVSTQFEAAESRGAVSRSRREYFMGHRLGSTDTIYNLGRTLSPEKVEELRESWKRVVPFLETNASTKIDVRAEVLGELLHAIEEATGTKTEGAPISAHDLAQSIRKLLGTGAADSSDSTGPPHSAPIGRTAQKVVDQSEVKALLDAGARFVSKWNDHEAIIELPQA